MRNKFKGVTLAATAIAIVAWMFLGYISFIVMASPFSVLAAVRTARQAEQYAEFVANSLKLVDYSELGTAAHARRSLAGEIAGSAGWESRVAIGAARQIGSNPDNLQRIATIDIFQTGDTLSRYTLQVPLSSAGSGGDKFPIGTILPYVGAIANIPTGWALCNGANGTPNLTGRFLEGVTSASAAKKTHAAGLPNLTGRTSHSFGWANPLIQGLIGANGGTGVFSGPHTGYDCNTIQQSDNVYPNGSPYIYFDASKCNSIYGNSTTVQPESYTVLYIMKIKA